MHLEGLKMIRTLPLLCALLLLLSHPANAMVYSWTDSAGTTHYTNKEYEIPMRYRAKVKARYPEQGDSSIAITPQNVTESQAPQTEQRVQTQSQTLQANQPESAKAVQKDLPPEYQQMKKERATKKARRNKDEE